MPLSATRVIHKNFSPHHEATAESAMTSTVDLTRLAIAVGTLNNTTGAVTNPATTLYTGLPARIQARSTMGVRKQLTGDQQVTEHEYVVQLPAATTGVLVDDHVTVTASNDENLTGRTLRVVDVTYGSEGFSLDLTCKDDLG